MSNWYEDKKRRKEGSFMKEGPTYSTSSGSSEEVGTENFNKTAMEMIKVRERSKFGDLLFEIIKVMAKIVEKEAQLEKFQRTILDSPGLGFYFTKDDDETGETFEVYCDFEIANDYMKIKVSGQDLDGNTFSGTVNMFMQDTLIKIGRRVASFVPSHRV